jgi:hypothetical protein
MAVKFILASHLQRGRGAIKGHLKSQSDQTFASALFGPRGNQSDDSDKWNDVVL